MNHRPKISAQVYLWAAMLLFATSNSLVRKLTQLGAMNLIGDRNPISPCNVLFASNLCALLVLIPVFHRQLTWKTIKSITRQEWGTLVLVATLSGAIAPASIFIALSHTMVSNVVLIGRIEPPIVLALSVWLLHDRVNRWEIAGTFLAIVGVICTILLQHPMVSQAAPQAGSTGGVGQGEIYTLIAVVASAVGGVINKARLNTIPLGLYMVVRMIIGTIAFFILANLLYGPHHFMEVTSPVLWRWMLGYGVIIVALGQFLWFRGGRQAPISTALVVNSFSPIAGIFAAYLILGERPMAAQYIGGSIILLGIILSQFGIWRKSLALRQPQPRPSVQQMESALGFKGV
jgi:drug/metabolite transporter (DMT)-like permease